MDCEKVVEVIKEVVKELPGKLVRQIVVDEIPTAGTGLVEREKLVNVMLVGGLQSFITFNSIGDLVNHSFVLNGAFDWTLGMDEDGRTVLIPLRK